MPRPPKPLAWWPAWYSARQKAAMARAKARGSPIGRPARRPVAGLLTCARCSGRKVPEAFSRDRTKPCGRRPYCKPCWVARWKAGQGAQRKAAARAGNGRRVWEPKPAFKFQDGPDGNLGPGGQGL